MSNVSYTAEEPGTGHCPWDLTERHCYFSRWMSVLQNSKEEALNNAFKGDENTGENNIVQELTKEIISEVQGMTGNDVCCDCGAPGDPAAPPSLGAVEPGHGFSLSCYMSSSEQPSPAQAS